MFRQKTGSKVIGEGFGFASEMQFFSVIIPVHCKLDT
jgi:hypothetical protein